MRSINNVFLLGNLAADVDLRETATRIKVANFSLATNRDWVTDGGKKSETDYHKIVVWRKLAENCAKYLGKGSLVHVSGRLSNRSYEKEKGDTRYITEIVADRVDFIKVKKESGVSKIEATDVDESQE